MGLPFPVYMLLVESCPQFEALRRDLMDYIEHYLTAFCKHGGQRISSSDFFECFKLALLSHMNNYCGLVPAILKRVRKQEFATITDIRDPRVWNDPDGGAMARLVLLRMQLGVQL